MDFRRSHIFVIPSRGGEPKQLTFGDFDDHSLSWTADGKEIVFVSDRSGHGDLFVRNDLWAVSVESGKVRQITATAGAAYRPSCSPDGACIAYLSTTRSNTSNDSVAEDSHVWVVPTKGGQPVDLVEELDRPCTSIAWSPDGREVFFTVVDSGRRFLHSVSSQGGEVKTVMCGDWQISRKEPITLSSNGRIAFIREDPVHAPEVFVSSVDGTNVERITHFNDEFIRSHSFAKPEPFWFINEDGMDVQGWLAKPIGYEHEKKYPTVLCVHGGPHNLFGYSFDERLQILASAGYAVVMVNPRGSIGYGQRFSDGCVYNWGGGDYRDIMEGLANTIDSNEFIDDDRLFVTGGSYGGYMTNLIITQTNRFKAAVSRACVSNLLSFYGTWTVFSLIEQEFPGLPYDNLSLLAQWSPISHVGKVRTPTLFLHGEVDYTCPIGQAEEMFRGLKRMGVYTLLVRYQGEGHSMRKPGNKVYFYERHLYWFSKYLE